MLSLILPTRNTQQFLPIVVQKIIEVLWREKIDVELICIDDASTDRTVSQLHYLSGLYKDLRYTYHRKKLGYYYSVLEGIAEAQGAIVGVIDTSLAHAPEYLPKLLKPVFAADVEVSIGSKFAPGSIFDGPWFQSAKLQFLSQRARTLVPLHDPLSNYFVARKDVLQGIQFSKIGRSVGLEIYVKGNYTSILEVGYHYIHQPDCIEDIPFREIPLLLKQFSALHRYKKTLSI
jgi:dolichol-phosphate mannosyltransferase